MADLAIDRIEKSSSALLDQVSSASNTSTSSRKSVRFASKDILIFDTSSTQIATFAHLEHNEGQSTRSSSATSSITSSNKRVRFAADDMVIWHPAAVTRVTPPSTDNTCIKNTMLANDHNVSSEPSNPQPLSHTAYHTLLDADTSLTTPLECAEPPFPPPLAPSSNLATAHPPSQTSTSTSSHEKYLNPAPPPSSPQHLTIEHPHPQTSALPLDPGEKDAQGHVLTPRTEPCEKCGGKVIWATKGEWLLVCEGCGEAQ